MTTEIHRCGGTLKEGTVPVVLKHEGTLFFVAFAPALYCDRCGEQLLERDVAHQLESAFNGTSIMLAQKLELHVQWSPAVLYSPSSSLGPLSSPDARKETASSPEPVSISAPT